MLCSRLFGGSGNGVDSLLLVDGLPECIGYFSALEPLNNLRKRKKVGEEESHQRSATSVVEPGQMFDSAAVVFPCWLEF